MNDECRRKKLDCEMRERDLMLGNFKFEQFSSFKSLYGNILKI